MVRRITNYFVRVFWPELGRSVGPHVSGAAGLEEINEKLGIILKAHRVDTISGLLFKHAGRILKAGDRIPLGPVDAEVMEVRATRAWKIRLQVGADCRRKREHRER